MRLLGAILLLAGTCGGLAAAEGIPLPRPRPPQPAVWTEPHTFREAAGADFKSDDVTDKLSACDERLAKVAVITPMPRLIGPGACGGGDIVELSAVLLAGNARVMIKPAPVLRCAMAEQLAAWVHDEAAPRVAKTGKVLQAVETYDDFDCRGRNRVRGAKLSEHGKGNAVDVRSLTLADGGVIRLTDMKAPKELRVALRETACTRFTTVLGPGSDGYHEEHIHLDLAERHNGYRICQWDVREPPKPDTLVASAQLAGKPAPSPVADAVVLPPAKPSGHSAAAAVKKKL